MKPVKSHVDVVGCMPAVRDIYEVLTAFVAGMTVQDVCSRLHPRLLGIDERHVTFFLVLLLYKLTAQRNYILVWLGDR